VIYDTYGTETGQAGYDSAASPTMDPNAWYRIILDYNAATQTADLQMLTGPGFATLFHQDLGFPVIADPFDRIGFGAWVGNYDGTYAELHVDNITVSTCGTVPEPATLIGLGMAAAAMCGYIRDRWRKI
jgi:hypothetical protein